MNIATRSLVIEYRSFLNTDTPLIVDIWRRQRPMRASVDSFDRTTLDTVVLAKPYFDRHGLIMAVEGEKPLGFVHAGFAPNSDLSDLDLTQGIISQLKIVDGDHYQEVANQLLTRACDYLRGKGSTTVHYGSRYPHAPFYLGLYGGSQIGGILNEDESIKERLLEFGFEAHLEILSYTRTLAGFRVAVDREQMGIRRQFNTTAIVDPIETSWWESCVFGLAERDCFHASHRSTGAVVASVRYWDIQPLARKWGVTARGIQEMKIDEPHQGTGLEMYLLGESLRHLMQQGIGLVEIQARSTDEGRIEAVRKLGFDKTGVATGLRMSLNDDA